MHYSLLGKPGLPRSAVTDRDAHRPRRLATGKLLAEVWASLDSRHAQQASKPSSMQGDLTKTIRAEHRHHSHASPSCRDTIVLRLSRRLSCKPAEHSMAMQCAGSLCAAQNNERTTVPPTSQPVHSRKSPNKQILSPTRARRYHLLTPQVRGRAVPTLQLCKGSQALRSFSLSDHSATAHPGAAPVVLNGFRAGL